MWIWLAIIIIFIIVLLHIVFPKRYNSLGDELKIWKIPGPRRVPYFGNMFEFSVPREKFLVRISEIAKKYKPIYRIDFLGWFSVTPTELDDIKIILNSQQHITKSDEYNFLLPWLGTGLLTSTKEKWSTHRKWLTPAFHFKILDQYIDIINQNANVLVEKIMGHVKNDFLCINPLITLCTLDIICETAMGTKVGAQTDGEKEYVKAILRMSQLYLKRLLSPWLYNEWIFQFSPTGREQKKVLKTLHGFTERVIKERKEAFRRKKAKNEIVSIENSEIEETKKMSFLDLIIEISETQEKMTETEIREEVDTFMFEGHDTTSAAICWALHELGWHPEIQQKVYQELKEIFQDSDRVPTQADLAEMKYLERVIKETLRLYPSVPIISRKLDVEIKLRDYVIPAGTNVPILVHYIHRDPKNFPNPDKFDPDRFLPEAAQGRHAFAYIPFSAGPRNCIGQRFAMMEEKIVLSQILRKFEMITLDKREEIELKCELILRPKENLRMIFKPRHDC